MPFICACSCCSWALRITQSSCYSPMWACTSPDADDRALVRPCFPLLSRLRVLLPAFATPGEALLLGKKAPGYEAALFLALGHGDGAHLARAELLELAL